MDSLSIEGRKSNFFAHLTDGFFIYQQFAAGSMSQRIQKVKVSSKHVFLSSQRMCLYLILNSFLCFK